jgi:hypothetical protein
LDISKDNRIVNQLTGPGAFCFHKVDRLPGSDDPIEFAEFGNGASGPDSSPTAEAGTEEDRRFRNRRVVMQRIEEGACLFRECPQRQCILAASEDARASC